MRRITLIMTTMHALCVTVACDEDTSLRDAAAGTDGGETDINGLVAFGDGVFAWEEHDAPVDTHALDAFSATVQTARYLGLGEPVHGTGGSHRLRARIVRDLITRGQMRALGFEAPWYQAQALGEFVAAGRCSVEEANEATLALRYYVWSSATIRDLVQWVCEYNRDNPSRGVEVFGFDPRGSRQGANAAFAEIDRVPDAVGDAYRSVQAECNTPDVPETGCFDSLNTFCALWESEQNAIEESLGPSGYRTGLRMCAGMRGDAGLRFHLDDSYTEAWESRDRAMADLIESFAEDVDSSTMVGLWAANSHLAYALEETDLGARSAGAYLRERFGERYLAVATIAPRWTTNWPGVLQHFLTPEDAFTHQVAEQVGAERFVWVDIAQAEDSLATAQPAQFFLNGQFRAAAPRELFSHVFYLDSSEAMETVYLEREASVLSLVRFNEPSSVNARLRAVAEIEAVQIDFESPSGDRGNLIYEAGFPPAPGDYELNGPERPYNLWLQILPSSGGVAGGIGGTLEVIESATEAGQGFAFRLRNVVFMHAVVRWDRVGQNDPGPDAAQTVFTDFTIRGSL